MALTQARASGAFTGRRYGSFAGRTASVHPVGRLTQSRAFGAHSGARYGTFIGRGGGSGTHPVGQLTQVRAFGAHTGFRYGSFFGRISVEPEPPEPITITNIGGIPEKPRFEFRIRPDIRRDDDEIMAVIVAFLHMVNNQ